MTLPDTATLPRRHCTHEGPLADLNIELGAILSSLESGEQFFVRGSCKLCGELVEREYAILQTLPLMSAQLFPLAGVAPEAPIASVTLAGVPAQLFMVHGDVIREGTCGLTGMDFIGVNANTKRFRYRCTCGFEWELCASDLEQAVTIQKLHKSAAARRFEIG